MAFVAMLFGQTAISQTKQIEAIDHNGRQLRAYLINQEPDGDFIVTAGQFRFSFKAEGALSLQCKSKDSIRGELTIRKITHQSKYRIKAKHYDSFPDVEVFYTEKEVTLIVLPSWFAQKDSVNLSGVRFLRPPAKG